MLFIEHGFIKALDEHTLLVSEDSIAQGYVAELVFIANDVSENTKKRLLDKCNFRNIKTILIFDRYELGNMIGREFSACIAITDNNFCNGILEQLGGEAIGKEESIHNS